MVGTSLATSRAVSSSISRQVVQRSRRFSAYSSGVIFEFVTNRPSFRATVMKSDFDLNISSVLAVVTEVRRFPCGSPSPTTIQRPQHAEICWAAQFVNRSYSVPFANVWVNETAEAGTTSITERRKLKSVSQPAGYRRLPYMRQLYRIFEPHERLDFGLHGREFVA